MIDPDVNLIRRAGSAGVIPADAGIQWHAKRAVAGISLDSGSSPE
ncbi:MAG: hypothetical protein Q8L71_04710 [Thiobacillus sp.]|nr:hypothetical protein [Thiobacillus sp.]